MNAMCFYVVQDFPAQRPKHNGGYIPSLVISEVPGHRPLVGHPEFGIPPVVVGPTLAKARAWCRDMNESIGVTPRQVSKIVRASMLLVRD